MYSKYNKILCWSIVQIVTFYVYFDILYGHDNGKCEINVVLTIKPAYSKICILLILIIIYIYHMKNSCFFS